MAWIRTQQLKQFTAFHALQQHVQQIFVGIRSMQRTNEWMIAYFFFMKKKENTIVFFFTLKTNLKKIKIKKKKISKFCIYIYTVWLLFENYALQKNDT